MNKRFVLYSIGKLLQVLGLILLVPAGIAFFEIDTPILYRLTDPRLIGFLLSILLSTIFGTILSFTYRKSRGQIDIKEGFAVVTFGWIILTLVGALPVFVYFVSLMPQPTLETIFVAFTDSYFEIMSGFTTTGASVIPNVEALPRGILFWRSLTHWLGGMGIVTLALALFPAFGVSAYQLFRGEVPGPSKERLKPRLAQTAIVLWGVYALLTLVETLLLYAGGMPIFDSLCHSFGTMATGGFSTQNTSIAAYNNDYYDWVITIFMFLAGVNFIIHYRILFAKDFSMLKSNREFHFYTTTIIIAVILGTIIVFAFGLLPREEVVRHFRFNELGADELSFRMEYERQRIGTLYQTLRHVTFQVLSIVTTTGYSVADWDMWPDFVRFMLVVLMFFGGSAGSTAGGIKMVRILVLLKVAMRELKVMVQPRLISPLKIAGQVLDEKQVANIIGFFLLFLLLFIVASGIMALMIPDFTTAVTSVVATLCNIGPGLSGVGAMETYVWIPTPGKWTLIICMLLGRLEIYTVLIAFSPVSWKK